MTRQYCLARQQRVCDSRRSRERDLGATRHETRLARQQRPELGRVRRAVARALVEHDHARALRLGRGEVARDLGALRGSSRASTV